MPSPTSVRSLWRPAHPVDLESTLGALARGPFDPTVQRGAGGAFWRASRTPEGAATTRLSREPDGVAIEAFGPGAAWAVESAPDLLGAGDDPSGFAPTGKLATLHRRHPGLRVLRTKAVYEACLRAICEQLVTGREAMQSFTKLTRKWGERAPGPIELLLAPPAPERLATLPTWELESLGFGVKRARGAARGREARRRDRSDGFDARSRPRTSASRRSKGSARGRRGRRSRSWRGATPTRSRWATTT